MHCEGCPHYEPVTRRILIIKLGAVGDVIRTTPLLRVWRQPGTHITWLTETPEILPKDWIDRILRFDAPSLAGEKYIVTLDASPPFSLRLPRPLIGLNTGCGIRWPSRLWAIENWIKLAEALQRKGLGVLLLGGPDEEQRNRDISAATGATYLGTFQLQRFLHLVNEVDVLVTGVTMAMHLGIGLNKRIVLFNNIFNRNEFELYGQGQILEPDV
ncbi:MAG: hypothetical protein NTW14_08585, partial [bacterium]|nr:hypothetical protein [bacterium]